MINSSTAAKAPVCLHVCLMHQWSCDLGQGVFAPFFNFSSRKAFSAQIQNMYMAAYPSFQET